MISLLHILHAQDSSLKPNCMKIVRHKQKGYDFEAGRRAGWFDDYHRYQDKAVFDGIEQVVVFLGEDGLKSRFIGVYDVSPKVAGKDPPQLPPHFPYPDLRDSRYYYTLTKRAEFEDLEDRLVIEWTNDAINWVKDFIDRPIVEIRAPGRVLPPFRDYLRVNLSFDELLRLTRTPEAHRDWVSGLSAVGAIYLIVNSQTGEQYVGSATGNGGLWQRWQEYAKTGHGGNVRLRDLCAETTSYPAAFTFSILETFSKTLSRSEAIESEEFFKRKLGSRAFGLNL